MAGQSLTLLRDQYRTAGTGVLQRAHTKKRHEEEKEKGYPLLNHDRFTHVAPALDGVPFIGLEKSIESVLDS